MNQPLVSVIIPCYNEKDTIEECILSVLNQKFPQGDFEILIIDGMSTDGTKNILDQIKSRYSNLRIIKSEKRFTPFALNMGIKESKGKFITILGAHSIYDPEFLCNNIKLFNEHPEISCSGGPIIHRGVNSFGKAVALAMSNPIGIGNAKHRFPDYEGYAEGAGFPTFKKEVFDNIGLYDEKFIKNQDDELNFRLTKSGGKIYLSSRVKSIYFVRETVSELFKQYFEYGFWRVAVIRKHKYPVSFRQLIPFLFFSSVILLSFLVLLVPGNYYFISLILPAIYLTILIISGVIIAFRFGYATGIKFPLAVAVLQLSYALGFLKGLIYKKNINN